MRKCRFGAIQQTRPWIAKPFNMLIQSIATLAGMEGRHLKMGGVECIVYGRPALFYGHMLRLIWFVQVPSRKKGEFKSAVERGNQELLWLQICC